MPDFNMLCRPIIQLRLHKIAIAFPAPRLLAVTLGCICFFALLFSGSSSRADNSITLELPPSAAALAKRAADRAVAAANRMAEAPASTAGARRQARSNTSGRANRTYYPSRGQSGEAERVVGRLGQVQWNTIIYRTQSTRSAHLSNVATGAYLAIQSEAGTWYGILMSDGSLGWLHKQGIHLLDYQVVSNGVPQQAAPSLPLGDFSDGLPASANVYFQGDQQALFREAYRYLGVPYHWGGNGTAGIDCSAFVKNVFQACGYTLPRHSSDQTAYGVAVPPSQLQGGDRLYFGTPATRNITHTGIYLGNGYFIHASSNSHGVAVSQLGEALYTRMYICARR